MPSSIRPAFCALPVLLASCGAGAVSAALFGTGGNGSATDAQPSVTITIDRGPLDIEPGERYEAAAVLSNIEIPAGSEVVVDLFLESGPGRAAEVAVRQPEVVLDAGAAGALRWRLETGPIRAEFADPTAQDVGVVVRIGAVRPGSEYVELGSGDFTLLRKRTARVTHPQNSMIPISGGSLAAVVTPRLAGSPRVEVRTAQGRTRAASIAERADDSVLDTTSMTIAVPPGDTTEEIEVVVVDSEAGRSVPIRGVFYSPRLLAVVGRSGSTDGDELIALIGAGLVPTRFESDGSQTPLLDRVEVAFSKGGRTTVVDRSSFLTSLSTPSALTLRSPPSPDGHPGGAGIEVRVLLDSSSGGQFVARDENKSLYAYAAALPTFEPRGIGLGSIPREFAFGRVTGSGPGPADAIILNLDPIDAVGLVRTLSNAGHGMFSRIGDSVPTSEPGFEPMRIATGICVGDFVGDPLRDVMVSNLGSGLGNSIASILPNDTARRGLFTEFVRGPLVAEQFPLAVLTARFDSHPGDDVLIVTLSNAGIAESGAGYAPRWVRSEFASAFDTGSLRIARPMDLEGDGIDEACFVVSEETRSSISIIYRDAGGLLDAVGPLDLTPVLFGYRPVRQQAIALRTPGEREIVIVLDPPDGDPTASGRLLRLGFDASWTNVATLTFPLPPTPSGGPFVATAIESGDLDGDSSPELVIGSEGAGIRIYETAGGAFLQRQQMLDFDGEPIGAVLGLDWEALDETRNAIYVTHQLQIGAIDEVRITTLIPDTNGQLRGPKARIELTSPMRRVLSTNEIGNTVAVVHDDSISTFVSDEFGELGLVQTVQTPGVVIDSVHYMDVAGAEWCVFVDEQGRLGGIGPGATAAVHASISPLVNDAVGQPTVVDGSRIVSGDVDGDGVDDLVALIRFDDSRPVSNPHTALVVLLSEPFGAFPFAAAAPVSASVMDVATARSIDLGNFALDAGSLRDEIAISIPDVGVRFLHYDTATQSVVRAELDPSMPPLADGESPELIRAIDLDDDLVDDLVILSRLRSEVSFWAQQQPGQGLVDVRGFVRIDAEPTAPASVVEIEPADLDGDGLEDLLIALRDSNGQPIVGAVFWSGTDRVRRTIGLLGERLGAVPTSMTEVRPFSITTVDTNQDGARDLLIGWGPGVSPPRPSLIQTLFGSRR